MLAITIFATIVTIKTKTITITTFTPSEVTIMLAITIFATIVGDMLPVTDSTPLIGELP